MKSPNRDRMIKDLFSYVSEFKYKNNIYLETVKIKLKKIFEYEVRQLNFGDSIGFEFERKFSSGSIAHYYDLMYRDSDGKYALTNKKVIINELSEPFHKILLPDKESRLKGISEILKSLYHEITHYAQNYYSRDKIFYDKNLYTVAREAAVFSVRKTQGDDVYAENHDGWFMELDADIEGFRFIRDYDTNYDYHKDKVEIMQALKELSKIKYTNVYGVSFVSDRDKFLDEVLDDQICIEGNAELLLRHPMLQCEYNFDCTKKDMVTLYYDMLERADLINKTNQLSKAKKEHLNRLNKELYFELFNKRLREKNDSEVQSLVNEVNGLELIDFFQDLKDYNNRERKRKSELFTRKREVEYKKYEGDKFTIDNNGGLIESTEDGKTSLISVYDFVDGLDLTKEEKILVKNIKHVRRIPRCGFFYAKDGHKVDMIEYTREYLVPELRKGNGNLKSFLRDNFLFTNESNYRIALEKINRELQQTNSNIDSILRPLIDKHVHNKFKPKTIRQLLYEEEEEIEKGMTR